ncbi:hypothetical protein HAX54_051469, partial [Datura stramonium]|nr:hypothetical protein [Datura stramonium]
HILLEKFYTGLDALTQSVANNTTGGSFKDKTFNHIAIILDKIAKHNHAWHGGDHSGGINVGTPSLSTLVKENQEHDQMMSTINNIDLLTKKLIESEVKKVQAIDESVTGVQ